MASEIRQKAHEIAPYIIEMRKTIHRHPELSMQEFWTTDFVAGEMEKDGIPYRRIEPTGIIAEIKGDHPGKTVALRADMDALTVEEKTGLPYASEVPGMMHACGHDTHVSMLLGAAKLLAGMKDQIHGTVRLIFQPGEEVAQGAKAVIAQGGLDGVDAIFGMHTSGCTPASMIGIGWGPIQAGATLFKIKIHGKASHGSQPEAGADATIAAAALVLNLQSIVSRELPPMEPCVVTVGKLSSGTRFNVVSGEAELEGTCRFFSPKIREDMPHILERIAKKTAETYRCTAEVEYIPLCDINTNNEKMADLMWEAGKKVGDSEDLMKKTTPMLGSEDFAEYSVRCPAAFAALGSGSEYSNHSNYFYAKEETLEVGSALYVQTALDFLNQ